MMMPHSASPLSKQYVMSTFQKKKLHCPQTLLYLPMLYTHFYSFLMKSRAYINCFHLSKTGPHNSKTTTPQKMRMRLLFLTWFIFVSCTQAISNSGFHTNLSSDKRGLNSSINNVQTQPPFGSYGSEDEEMIYASIKKAHGGGKGAGGGSNVDHRPTRSGSATPPLLSWSSTMCVCLTLVLMLFFHIEIL